MLAQHFNIVCLIILNVCLILLYVLSSAGLRCNNIIINNVFAFHAMIVIRQKSRLEFIIFTLLKPVLVIFFIIFAFVRALFFFFFNTQSNGKTT